jgi:hypothetical protein
MGLLVRQNDGMACDVALSMAAAAGVVAVVATAGIVVVVVAPHFFKYKT